MSSVVEERGAQLPRPAGAARSKLRPPRLRPEAIPRTELLDRLAVASPSVVIVQAPAGFGKTTVARQWIEADPRSSGWVALDEGDDDPVALVRAVVQAVDSAAPLPTATAAALQQPPAIDAAVLPALDADLQAAPPFVLVLDDVHRVTSPASVGLLDRLLDLVPEGSTVVLCSRTEAPVHLARRRLAGGVVQLGRADLAFGRPEARRLVSDGLPWASPEVAEAVVEGSEGWPAGLQLTVLALQGRAEVVDADQVPVLSLDATAGYLREELLDGLPEDDRNFLIRAAVLDPTCGALCDHVLDTTGSGERLARLASSGNLFVNGLEHDRRWYRCHHLFQELLLDELRRVDPLAEPELRRRAAEWLTAAGQPDAAVDQAIRSGDVAFAAQQILEQARPALSDGRLITLGRWLGRFTLEQRRGSIGLALASGLLGAVALQPDEAIGWFDVVARRPDVELSRLELLSRHALIVLGGHLGTEASFASAQQLVAAGTEANPWYAYGLLQEAVIGHLLGEVPDPGEGLERARFHSQGEPAVHLAASAQLAIFLLVHGDRQAGQELALATWADVVDRHLEASPMMPAVHLAAGLALAQQGRPEWRDRLGSGLALFRSLPSGPVRAMIQLRLVAAEAALAAGDIPLARTLHVETAALLPRTPARTLHRWAAELGARLDTNPRLPAGGAELTKAERAVLEQLATHRTLVEVGEQLFVSRNTVKSHTISIYRKLGVSGRSAAVEQGRALGLLADPTPGGFTRSG